MDNIEHNHTTLGRKGDCAACQARLPDVENPDTPPGCTYVLKECGIDEDFVCVRHGFFAPGDVVVNEKSTIPCRAIQKVGSGHYL